MLEHPGDVTDVDCALARRVRPRWLPPCLPSILGAFLRSVVSWRIGRCGPFFSKRRRRNAAASWTRLTSMALSFPGFRRTLALRQLETPPARGTTSTGFRDPGVAPNGSLERWQKHPTPANVRGVGSIRLVVLPVRGSFRTSGCGPGFRPTVAILRPCSSLPCIGAKWVRRASSRPTVVRDIVPHLFCFEGRQAAPLS